MYMSNWITHSDSPVSGRILLVYTVYLNMIRPHKKFLLGSNKTLVGIL